MIFILDGDILKYRVGTRKSILAQFQTDRVIEMLWKKLGIQSEKILIDTTGDRRLDIALNEIGGKGLFIKEIEAALLNGEIDAAVHSMKDVPAEISCEFEIAAICDREDPRDVFISSEGIHFANLKKGARIGTGSNRRAGQIKQIRDDIEIVPLRGNVNTRIKKMKSEKLSGIVLAAAGVKRLGLEPLVTDYFDIAAMVPAVGQGAIGVETCKGGDEVSMLRKMDNLNARRCVEAERSFMKKLNGDCHSTIGAHAKISGSTISIFGMFEVKGKIVKKNISGNVGDYIKLGEKLAEKVLGE